MVNLNKYFEQAKILNNKYKKILDEQLTPEGSVLGLHESATKLWVAVKRQDKNEVEKRIASALIGVLLAANTLEVSDLENCFQKRMVEIEGELQNC